ncbi:MAG: 30S ribosomal protein S4 [Nitrospiraceae bacterium]|nr:30S ribosomal protein S4 [Nitrospiraceae bacterium]
MARYTGSLCRVCRRQGEKLFLKGERCSTEKCAVERRKYAPGQHGQRRSKISDYGLQLKEKQKAKKNYGVLEKQFRRYFHEAERQRGTTGEVLLQLLERRLDNVIFRMGFAVNRREARQYISHGHFSVNGKRTNIPSYLVKIGDSVEVKEASREIKSISENISKLEHKGLPAWIQIDAKNYKGKILHIPSRDEMQLPIEEQLIVEFYSK